MPSVIAHYQEIALKGRNRGWFLQRLVNNITEVLEGIDGAGVRTPMGRLEVVFARDSDWPEVHERLSRTFGLANFSLARRAPLDVQSIGDAILEHLPHEPVDSFRVTVRRADKQFPMLAPDIERAIGSRVQDARG